MASIQDRDKALDKIIKEMVSVVSNSKQEIFEIGEESRKQQNLLGNELKEIKDEVKEIFDESELLERNLKKARVRLLEVSKNFNQFSEEEVRKIYNHTHQIQTQLIIIRQKETTLIKRRDELEQRIKALSRSIERTENLMSKINVVLQYLNEDFKNINEALESAKEKHAFGLQIIEAQEEERRKLSREIHDGPAQMLANVLIRSDIVDKTFRQRGIEAGIREIKEMKEMVRGALFEVRRVIYDLRPMALDDLGLIPTLRKYLTTVEEYHHIKIEFYARGKEERYSQKFETAVFRLIQEATQNAVKHSNASLIRVLFEATSQQLNIIIDDNGKGFNKEEIKDKSFGLLGMRERIQMLEGDFKIDSEIGKGTKVIMSLPCIYLEKIER
ncbi:sensor histidine kinase [Bacillaceae bacterium W0354]